MKTFGAWHLEACSECRPQRQMYWRCPAPAAIAGPVFGCGKTQANTVMPSDLRAPFLSQPLAARYQRFCPSLCFKTEVPGWKLPPVHDNRRIIEASYMKFRKNLSDNPKYRRTSIRSFSDWSWETIKVNEIHAWEYPYRRGAKELKKCIRVRYSAFMTLSKVILKLN